MKTYSVKQTSEKLSLHPMYVRKLCREEKLVATKDDYGFYRISEESVLAYKAHRIEHSNSKSFVIKVDNANVEEVLRKLTSLGVSTEKRYSYDSVKAKIYREKRKANKKS